MSSYFAEASVQISGVLKTYEGRSEESNRWFKLRSCINTWTAEVVPGPQAIVANQMEGDRLVKQVCAGVVQSASDMILKNPYKTTGCYEVFGYVVQWLGPDQALISVGIGPGLIKVDFPKFAKQPNSYNATYR